MHPRLLKLNDMMFLSMRSLVFLSSWYLFLNTCMIALKVFIVTIKSAPMVLFNGLIVSYIIAFQTIIDIMLNIWLDDWNHYRLWFGWLKLLILFLLNKMLDFSKCFNWKTETHWIWRKIQLPYWIHISLCTCVGWSLFCRKGLLWQGNSYLVWIFQVMGHWCCSFGDILVILGRC